jgi:outer membrane protein insertion porin family
MAEKRTKSGCNRQLWLNSLWPTVLAALLLTLAAWAHSVAAELDGPELTVASPTSTPAAPVAASKAETVKDVRVAGNKLSLEKILPSIHTRAGRAFDQELVDEDVKRLISTRQFIDVKPYLQRTPDGVIVIFDLLERPILKEVKIVGCLEIRKAKLLKEAMLKVGDPADPSTIEKARHDMEEYYHKEGFSNARVWVFEGNKPEDRRAIFVVNEGVKQKVWEINVVGATFVSGDRLKTQISTSRPFLYLFGGELDRKKLDEDVEKLTDFYRRFGFFRARVGRDVVFNDKGNWATIAFVVDEGIRYKVRNVSVVNNRKYCTEQLTKDIKLTNGEFFNRDSMKIDVRSMQDMYGGVGYVFAAVKPDMLFLEEPGQLDLVYNISEGGRYRYGKINIAIKGDYSHTQENTVRNRLFFKPGDIVDVRDIRASEAALKRCGIFETNMAEGTAPKIVLTPPGQDYDEPERKDKRQLARGGPGGDGTSGGPMFRGQSPDDPPSRDRVVNVTIDCGRYIGPTTGDENAAARQPDATQATQVRPTPCAAANVPQANQTFMPRQNDRQDESANIFELARQHQAAIARQRQPDGERLPRTGVLLTQYTSSPGSVNPAAQSLDWTSGAASNSAPAPAVSAPASNAASYPPYNPPYNPPPPQNTPQPQRAAFVPAGATAPQAVPAAAAPAYGQSMPDYSRAASNDPSRQPPPIDENNDIFTTHEAQGSDPTDQIQSIINTHEAMTGRIMFGVGVNSDAGLVGSVVLDEQNFNWTRLPSSWEDISDATAWRGAGQKFRLEAAPGVQVSRYSVTFQEPYAFGSNVSLGLNGYYYNRVYNEYEEYREGGRIALGYQFTPALSGSIAYRGANVYCTNAIDLSIPSLAEVNNRNFALDGFSVTLTNDRRDNAFLATEGYLLEASFEEVIGSFTYPRAELDMRKYFRLGSRPDGSGRQVLTLSSHVGITGDNTPIYDRFYAGGFSSLRGFAFRGADPSVYSVSTGTMCYLGGDFEFLASAEYMFPVTADDMIRGVVFCDTGTVEQSVNQWHDKYRVAPGFGLRICVPAMGPAPIALDFAFPIAWNPGDQGQLFSFFVGFGR